MIAKHPSIDPMHPGEIVREDILPELAMSEIDLANALNISRKTLREILSEKRSVTPEIAVQFGKLFGNGSRFWIHLQRTYDLEIAQRASAAGEARTLRAQPS